MDVVIKYADLESTKKLGNNLVIKEANILAEHKGNETVRREQMFLAEKIAREKTNILR